MNKKQKKMLIRIIIAAVMGNRELRSIRIL